MKEKKLSGILNCADAVIEKIEQFMYEGKVAMQTKAQ